MEDYVKGTFKNTIFSSDKGYIIGLLKVSETNIVDMQDFVNKTITFTGYFAELNLNEKYVMYGEIVNHPKYGFQFNVTESKKVQPEDKDGIVEFLSSDLFKGIGEKLAKKIAYTVKRTKKPVALEPMNPYERRVIHSALQNDRYVCTKSEGEEPYRKVVIMLKRDR